MNNIDKLFNRKFVEYDKYKVATLNVYNSGLRSFLIIVRLIFKITLLLLILYISLLFSNEIFKDTGSLLAYFIVLLLSLSLISWGLYKISDFKNKLLYKLNNYFNNLADISMSDIGFRIYGISRKWNDVEFTSEFEFRNIKNINESMISEDPMFKSSTYTNEPICILYKGKLINIYLSSLSNYNFFIEGILYFYYYKQHNKKF